MQRVADDRKVYEGRRKQSLDYHAKRGELRQKEMNSHADRETFKEDRLREHQARKDLDSRARARHLDEQLEAGVQLAHEILENRREDNLGKIQMTSARSEQVFFCAIEPLTLTLASRPPPPPAPSHLHPRAHPDPPPSPPTPTPNPHRLLHRTPTLILRSHPPTLTLGSTSRATTAAGQPPPSISTSSMTPPTAGQYSDAMTTTTRGRSTSSA